MTCGDSGEIGGLVGSQMQSCPDCDGRAAVKEPTDVRLPKTERGRTTLAWKLLDRIVAYGEQSADITPSEPLTPHLLRLDAATTAPGDGDRE